MNGLIAAGLALIIGVSPGDGVGEWSRSATVDLTASQVTLHDWAQGGQEAASWRLLSKGSQTLTEPRLTWRTSYRVQYGQSKVGDTSLRKSDDLLQVDSQVTRKLVNWFVHPTAGVSLRSQFRPGKRDGAAVSDFLDPAYLTYNAGAGREFIDGSLRLRGGWALRQIRTQDFPRYADDPSTPQVEKTSTSGGLDLRADLELPVYGEIATLASDNRAFRKLGDEPWVLESDTTLRVGLGRLTISLNLQLIDDERSSERLQVKTTSGLGVGWKL